MGDNSCFTLLILGSLLATLEADNWPKFINNPEPIVVPLGDEVEFECSLDNKALQLRWKHNGTLLSRVYNDTAKSQLIFKMDNESKIGDYQCIASYGAFAMASNPARLSLAKIGPMPPPIINNLNVSPGNNVLIKCRIPYSNPAAVIQYYKNNESLQASQILNTGTLLLTNVTHRDSGRYSCSITNTYVYQDAIFMNSYDTLYVGQTERRPPRFFHPPQNRYNVQAGSNITLDCVGYGEPVPKVTWRRRDGLLSSERSTVTVAGLRLVNVVDSDEGTYICEMDNGIYPPLIYYIDVTLQEPPTVEMENLAPRINESERVDLSCKVSGKPPPKITWLLNGESVRNDPKIVANGSTIHILSVEKRHAGMFQCMAENELGSSFNSSILYVVPRQVIAKGSTSSSSLDSHYHGKSVNAVSHPRSDPKHRKSNKSKNEMVPPSAPEVTRLTDQSVMVRWRVPPNDGLHIQFFKVQYREFTKGKTTKWMTNNEDILPHVHSYEIRDLTPNRHYKFRIAAVYSNDDNKLSQNSSRFYLQAVSSKHIPAAPRLTHTSAAGPEAIQIIWEYQGGRNPISGFYVYYRETSTAGEYLKATVEGEVRRSYVIDHLLSDTAYDVKLQSFNQDAASDFSEIFTQKTERQSTVSPPPTEPTSTNINIESNEPSKSSNQLYITLGAALGGLALLLMLCLGIFFCNKHRHTSSDSQDGDGPDKSRHIQLEPINVNGHLNRANGHVPKSNGYLSSKMNITSNPLADNDEDKNQNVMEISFITRTSTTTTTTNQNNNCTHNHRPPRPEVTSKNKTETASSKIEINHRVSQICEESFSSSDESSLNDAMLPSCALESDTWRRCDVARTVENYV